MLQINTTIVQTIKIKRCNQVELCYHLDIEPRSMHNRRLFAASYRPN